MKVKHFFDPTTCTLTYVVWDEESFDAVLIDPVLDYQPNGSRISLTSLNYVLDWILGMNLNLRMVLETHAHADHLSGAHFVKEQFPHTQIAIGQDITKVQKIFADIYNLKSTLKWDLYFDRLLKDQEKFQVGSIAVKVLSTPGHTPACCSYLIEDMVFTGDAMFMPDYGVGRCDFPGGSASDLYESVQKLYQLPNHIRVFTGHDYQPGGRPLKFESTIGEQLRQNIHINFETKMEKFVAFRQQRDRQLDAPRLLYPSIFINIRGGKLPDPESNGCAYLKIPLHVEQAKT